MEKCKYCDSYNLETRIKPPHIGLYCSDCGKFQTWVKQNNVIPPEIASEAQQKYALDLLRKWKTKNESMTTHQAGAIIKAFEVK